LCAFFDTTDRYSRTRRGGSPKYDPKNTFSHTKSPRHNSLTLASDTNSFNYDSDRYSRTRRGGSPKYLPNTFSHTKSPSQFIHYFYNQSPKIRSEHILGTRNRNSMVRTVRLKIRSEHIFYTKSRCSI
jgi:hypothetical protein